MRLEADHHSDEYEQAPMPYAIFFSPRGLAIHGTFERGLGSPRSHGCVRLAVGNARKLFEWVEQQGGASIDIVGSGRAAAYRPPREERPGRSRRSPAPDGFYELPMDDAVRY
jgi:hypothetical protein